MKNITMKTTWGNRESIDINDKEYTKVCSFLKNGCKIDINTDLEKYKALTKYEGDINDNITDDTFLLKIFESIKGHIYCKSVLLVYMKFINYLDEN